MNTQISTDAALDLRFHRLAQSSISVPICDCNLRSSVLERLRIRLKESR